MIDGKKVVLIIEDTDTISRTLDILFQRKNIISFIVATIRETREILSDPVESSLIDAVSLDLGLPDGLGDVLIPDLAKLPNHPRIVVNSAIVRTQDQERLMSLGASAVIPKPFDFSELVLALFPQLALE